MSQSNVVSEENSGVGRVYAFTFEGKRGGKTSVQIKVCLIDLPCMIRGSSYPATYYCIIITVRPVYR